MQSLTETHETPESPLPPGADPGLGLGTTDQVGPFQGSIKVFLMPLLFVSWPTATHSLADRHETPDRAAGPEADPGFGLGGTDQGRACGAAASPRPARLPRV